MTVGLIAAIAVAVAGLVVAVALLITGARGTSRVLAIVGAFLLLLGVLTRFAYQWMVERYLGRVDDATIVTILAADTAAGGILTGAGLLLISSAVAVASRLPKI
jgi:hypothetical protein